MGKQHQRNESPTRVEDLAAEIFLQTVHVSSGKTTESLAAEAFKKSEAFWEYASRREPQSEK